MVVTNVICVKGNDDVFHLAARLFRDRIKSEMVLEVRGGVVMSVENGNVVTYLLRKVLAILSFFLGMGFFLSGCTLSASSVELHTKEEMQKILDERYGDAEFVSMEENKENHRRVFTFRDKKYGFTYQVTSRPNGVGLDGSNFYYDGASVYYEYQEPFLTYFAEQEKDTFAKQGIELCDDLSFVQNFSYPGNKKFSLRSKTLVSSPEDYEKDLQFVMDRVHAYKAVPELDMDWYEIKVYNSEELEYLGTMKASGFSTAEEERIEYFMQQARELGGIQDVTYLRKEKKKISELGISGQNFYEQSYNKNDKSVTAYYYSHEGKEYFIIDQWVAQIGDNGGGIFQYYQSYKYYEPSRD